MTRLASIIVSGVLLGGMIFLALFVPSSAQAAAFCGDSWGSDGHPGPWYSGAGQVLHGNTLVIGGSNCTSGYMWNVTYEVVKVRPSDGQQFFPIMVVKNGDGPTSFSISVNPVGCNQGWIYYTQVRNNITGNWIRKPNSGTVIC